MSCDPVWRLPFHSEYESMIESTIAHLDNAPKSGMAGSITAALFLKRFVENADILIVATGKHHLINSSFNVKET